MADDNLIREAARMIRASKVIAVLTGAGVSKESGVPTFRDAMDGLWARFDPQQLATPQAFLADPKTVWDWYEHRRALTASARPNPGHVALAELERRCPGMTVITQNVDDLHEPGGKPERHPLHGNIARNRCFFNCQGEPTLVDISTIAWDRESGPPPCPHCGRWVRPDVVWFGEMLPRETLEAAQRISFEADVMLVVGTSGLVTPAADLPRFTRESGGKIVEVNPDYTMITRIADLKLEGPSGEILPLVLKALDSHV
jgi:NAD-dependent deacetylase